MHKGCGKTRNHRGEPTTSVRAVVTCNRDPARTVVPKDLEYPELGQNTGAMYYMGELGSLVTFVTGDVALLVHALPVSLSLEPGLSSLELG